MAAATCLAFCLLLVACRPSAPEVAGSTPSPASAAKEPTKGAPAIEPSEAPAVADAAPVDRPAVAPGPVPPVLPAERDGPEMPTPRSESEAPARRVSFPVRRGAVNDITFDDLELDMPLGTLFDRSMLTPRAAQLDGQQVRIRGFIYAGGVFQQTGITSFPLVKNTECKFGPQGLAYCVLLVDLDEGVKTDFTTYPVTVEGTLTVRPFDSGGFTWSVYHVQGRRVSRR